jgi:pimeloyl-ACP methyl ester carboxylesterase
MFRDLIPQLTGFHVIAPDYPGSGNSEAPSAETFAPTFDNLAGIMDDFIGQMGLEHYIIYMQDFGGPVGFRIALRHPERVAGLIIQNANAYEEGVAPALLQGIRERSGTLTPKQEADVEEIVSRDFAMFLYQTGASNPAGMNPDAWNLDSWTLQSPDAHRIQAALLVNYYSNLPEYPKWQEFLRDKQPRTLIVWGKGDPVFLPAGAQAYLRDVPTAALHFYNTSPFALDEEAPAIAADIHGFFQTNVGR